MYTVRTRNFNGNKHIAKILNFSRYLDVKIFDRTYTGMSGKKYFDANYILETKSRLTAWATWIFFMAIRKYSGGWTYIERPGKCLDDSSRSIY